METNYADLAEQIYNSLMGANFQVTAYDNKGELELDPRNASRFVATDPDIIVNLDRDQKMVAVEYDTVLSNDPVMEILENLAMNNGLDFDRGILGKTHKPKTESMSSLARSLFTGGKAPYYKISPNVRTGQPRKRKPRPGITPGVRVVMSVIDNTPVWQVLEITNVSTPGQSIFKNVSTHDSKNEAIRAARIYALDNDKDLLEGIVELDKLMLEYNEFVHDESQRIAKRIKDSADISRHKHGKIWHPEDYQDLVKFGVSTDRAQYAVTDMFGDFVSRDEEYHFVAPRKIWSKIQQVAYDADGVGAEEIIDEGKLANLALAGILATGIGAGGYVAGKNAADIPSSPTPHTQQSQIRDPWQKVHQDAITMVKKQMKNGELGSDYQVLVHKAVRSAIQKHSGEIKDNARIMSGKMQATKSAVVRELVSQYGHPSSQNSMDRGESMEIDTFENSDPSGLFHAAKYLNKSFLVRAEMAEGGTKTFRVKAQSERVAREKFAQHHAQAKILSVKEEAQESEQVVSERVYVMIDKKGERSTFPAPNDLEAHRIARRVGARSVFRKDQEKKSESVTEPTMERAQPGSAQTRRTPPPKIGSAKSGRKAPIRMPHKSVNQDKYAPAAYDPKKAETRRNIEDYFYRKEIGETMDKQSMTEVGRDASSELAKRIEKKTGGKETAVRNPKTGQLVTAKKKGVKEEADAFTFWKEQKKKAGGWDNIDWHAHGVEHGKKGIIRNPPYGVGSEAVNLYYKGLKSGKQGMAEGPKDTKPGWMLRQMRGENDPAFQKIADKQAAMAALKQPSKNKQQGVAEGTDRDRTVHISKEDWNAFADWMESEGLGISEEDGIKHNDLGDVIELVYPPHDPRKNSAISYMYASDWDVRDRNMSESADKFKAFHKNREKQGVAEGSDRDRTVHISKDDWTAFEDWMESEGLGISEEDGIEHRDLGDVIELIYPPHDPRKNSATSYMYASGWDVRDRKMSESKVLGVAEAAKWRSTAVAKKVTDPGSMDTHSYDYHNDNPLSSGLKRATSDTETPDYNKRRPAEITTRGPRTGKATRRHIERLKAKIRGQQAYGDKSKPNLPEEVDQMDEQFVIHKGKHEPGTKSSLGGQTLHGITVKDVYTDKKEAEAHAAAINKGRGYKPGDEKNSLYGGVLYQVSPRKNMQEEVGVAEGTVMEGFGHMLGSSKTSYQPLDGVKIIVRHKAPVAEEVRGSRSRNIKEIFIQRGDERFKMKEASLQAARAMARHVHSGGEVYDQIGKAINEMATEQKALSNFVRFVTRSGIVNETNQEYVDLATKRVYAIRETLRKLMGPKTYANAVENINSEVAVELTETDLDLESKFTSISCDQRVTNAVASMRAALARQSAFESAIQEAINKEDFGAIKHRLQEQDAIEFENATARLAHQVSQLSNIAQDARLGTYLNNISKKIGEGIELEAFETKTVKLCLERAKCKRGKKMESQDPIKESNSYAEFLEKFDIF